MEVILVIVAIKCDGVKSVVRVASGWRQWDVDEHRSAWMAAGNFPVSCDVVKLLRSCLRHGLACWLCRWFAARASCRRWGAVLCCVAIITRSFKFINKI
jgi:hypothetical protein